MREMKDSGIEWIGAMPRAWKMNTIAQIFLQVKCKNTGLQEKNLLSLSYGKVKRKSIDTVEGLLPESFDGYNIIEKDDIVLRLTDLQNDHTSLRVGLAEERGIITSAYLTIRNRSNFYPRYLYYYLHSFDIAKGFYGMGAGVRQGLNWDGVKWLKILAPSVPEQERIAAFLDAECSEIDAVLETTRASIEEYKKLKQAVITQAVTKGIRGNRPMKDSGIEWIGDIPAEWRKTQLRHCAAIKSGITLGKKYEKTDSLVERPYLRVANVQDGYVDLSVLTTIKVTQDEDLKYRLHAGDVLMTEGGDRDKLGRGCVWHGEIEPCLHQNHIFAVQTSKDTLLPEFLEYLTVSDVGRSYFDVTAIKTTNLACTSSSKVLAFTIPLPSVEEQAEIVEALNTKCAGIDALIAKKQQYLTEVENYKKSLIYEYVTGKKEVKTSVLAD